MDSSPSLLTVGFANFLLHFPWTPRANRPLAPNLALALGLCSLCLLAVCAPTVSAQATSPTPIPATKAFDAPPCSDVDLPGLIIDYGFGSTQIPSPQRTNPEWKAIILDSTKAANLQPPIVAEGFVSPQANDETSSSQATSEVAEEDLPWNHYTHDFTFKLVPDPSYQWLLSSWLRFPGLTLTLSQVECLFYGGSYIGNNQCVLAPAETCPDGSPGGPTGTTCQHTDMEVEWDSASLMDEKEHFQRDWGAVPEFVWPTASRLSSVADRVWVSGRWIFDCGHSNVDNLFNASGFINVNDYVKFSTEIHPPRALVTFRLNHTALDSFPFSRTSAPNFPYPQSYLPVTGVPVDPATLPPGVPDSGPTNVPVTEADVFVSVNGGAANDLCSIVSAPCSGHTGPIIPVNDRNYVFDIYPPITDYGLTEANGTFKVFPPVADASLQWRVEDHSTELPLHACGTANGSGCVTVTPTICLLDNTTPPPDQSETGCPTPAPTRPTRLRVILPFAGSNANYFAQSILLGWDDVPDPAGHATPVVRTFKVALHKLTVNHNGVICCFNSGDWRVFVNVGGQYRYISQLFDTNANNGTGIFQFDGGSNVCNGAPLTSNGDGDCYQFDNTPWIVSVVDGIPIHVAVGGFVARGVEDSGNALYLCRNVNLSGGCGPPSSFGPFDNPFIQFPFSNDDRIGTYEFDLTAPSYTPPNPWQTKKFDCTVKTLGGCDLQYTVAFSVQEISAATAPSSAPLVIGLPNYLGAAGTYISAATPMILQTADPSTEGFQYRFHRQGAPLPVYTTQPTQPFPVHWTHVDLAPGVHSAEVRVGSANSGDGPYDFQYSAESFGNLLEPRHTAKMILDNTPPVISIAQPQATSYPHSAVLTLDYSVDDGTGSGVQSFTPLIDNSTTLRDGTGLQSGQAINLLTELTLGQHTFAINAVDNVGNAGSSSVTFTIIVTADSIKGDINQFLAMGAIRNTGLANSLLAELNSAAKARTRGNCNGAANIYRAFVNELQAQSGKGVSAQAAAIMIADAQYLIAHCP
jgi:hypothetical protein